MLSANEIGRSIIDNAPLTLAREYLGAHGKCDEELAIRHWQGDFYQWKNGAFSLIPLDELIARLWGFVNGKKVRCLNRGKPLRYVPTQAKIEGIIAALRAETQVYGVEQMPAWLDTARPRSADMIAFKNGLLDVNEWIENGGCLLRPPSPLWFSTMVLPYQFDKDARCDRWIAFLNDVFEGDTERISLLQEWLGYLLTADTSQQKLLLLVGPPRSGKGTICRVTEQVCGPGNVVWPTLSDLAQRFGLVSLMGKSVAIIGDAHLVRDQGSARIVEILKSITGEDAVRIDRKNRDALPSVRIGARFFICANELPQLPDTSSALSTRLLLLRMRKSFVGHEDRGLGAALSKERPGVLRWALEGLARLREHGAFTVPQDSLETARAFEELSSPIKSFLEDRCILGQGETEFEDLYRNYLKWCEINGRKTLASSAFASKLWAAAPSLEITRPRRGGSRRRLYSGIALRELDALDEDLARIDAISGPSGPRGPRWSE